MNQSSQERKEINKQIVLSNSIGDLANNRIKAFSGSEIKETWTKCLLILSKKLNKASFDTWIRNLELREINGSIAQIAVRNEFTRNFINQSYKEAINLALKETLAAQIAIEFLVDPSIEVAANSSETPIARSEQSSLASVAPNNLKTLSHKINKCLTFENLVIGDFNKTANVFAQVLLSNDLSYKSLFINSASGLGKSHLLHACGNFALEKNFRILFSSAENFTNEFIIAIQRNNIQEFKNKYRNLDLLLFDDFAFLDNKKACQEEFAYTFEHITNKGGKVIIASSKQTKEFKLLSPKLASLISGSLNATIAEADFETRVKIIESKIKDINRELDQNQKETIAGKFYKNIRELEGALAQLNAMSRFTNCEIDDVTIENLFGARTRRNKALSAQEIIETVAIYYGISIKEIIGKSRQETFTKPRHLAMYLIHELIDLSYVRIGELFSNRKHSSVIHSLEMIKKSLNGLLPGDKFVQKARKEILGQFN